MLNIFKRKNETNSSLNVTCIAKGTCEFRHTTLCNECKNNLGIIEEKSYFEPKKS